ncbi:MAG: hypothetical protein ABS882_06280 [Lysinibacillus sp.]
MDKLKLRLEPLKLSEEQKHKIMQQAEYPKKKFVFTPFIMPAFVAIALLLIAMNVLPAGEMKKSTGQLLFTEQAFPTRYYVLMILSTIEVIVAYILLRLTLAKTKRWKNRAIMQELYALCVKLPLALFVLAIIIGLMWFGLYYFADRLYVEIIFSVWTYCLIFIISLHDLRDMSRTVCPHCGVKYTRREIIVKASMQFRERCKSCKQLVYLTKNSKRQLLVLFFWPVMPIWIGNFASLYDSVAMVFCVVNIVTLVVFYIPILTEFTKENTDPEKMIE